VIAVVASASFAFIGSYVLLRLINVFIKLRVNVKDEERGLDLSQHGETAYE
jgi:Amt family ammonium transporter